MTTPPSSSALMDATARWQLVVLGLLCLAAFWAELAWLADFASRDMEAAHTIPSVLLAALLVYQRRHLIAAAPQRGSPAGIVVIAAAIVGLALCYWPFNFGAPRRGLLIVALGGSVLAILGWRVLYHCLPALLLLLIAVPIGPRYYGFLILAPEFYTLEAARVTLDALPGVLVSLEAQDLHYITDDNPYGTIALGEYHRGATLLFAYLSIVVFVTFARIRPAWQVVAMAILSVPIVLLCNYFRLVVYGLVTIYGETSVWSPVPRLVAAFASLLAAYGLAVLASAMLGKILVDEPKPAAAT